MSQDFTSFNFPMMSGILNEGEENHMEPASEAVKTSVKGGEHPLFGLTESVNVLNHRRSVANSLEKIMSGDTKQQVITDMIKASYQQKFPVEMLMFAADWDKDFTQRSDMSDASSIIQKIAGYVPSLSSSLGRNPKNFELFMAHAVQSAGTAFQLIQKAQQKPNEKSTPVGSKKDDIIFYKKKYDQKVLRTNKEVVQFFYKRMLTGNDYFPWLPLASKT